MQLTPPKQTQESIQRSIQAERKKMRDDFAKAALTEMLSAPREYHCKNREEFAAAAYRYADAMLKEREK